MKRSSTCFDLKSLSFESHGHTIDEYKENYRRKRARIDPPLETTEPATTKVPMTPIVERFATTSIVDNSATAALSKEWVMSLWDDQRTSISHPFLGMLLSTTVSSPVENAQKRSTTTNQFKAVKQQHILPTMPSLLTTEACSRRNPESFFSSSSSKHARLPPTLRT